MFLNGLQHSVRKWLRCENLGTTDVCNSVAVLYCIYRKWSMWRKSMRNIFEIMNLSHIFTFSEVLNFHSLNTYPYYLFLTYNAYTGTLKNSGKILNSRFCDLYGFGKLNSSCNLKNIWRKCVVVCKLVSLYSITIFHRNTKFGANIVLNKLDLPNFRILS